MPEAPRWGEAFRVTLATCIIDSHFFRDASKLQAGAGTQAIGGGSDTSSPSESVAAPADGDLVQRS